MNAGRGAATPIEFAVEGSHFEEEERCLVLGGVVVAGAPVQPGMKVSVAVNRSFALELRIDRVDRVRECGRCAWLEIRVRAGGRAEMALLAGLDVRDELALVWEAADAVDPVRHFEGAVEREVCIDLRGFGAVDG